MKDGWHQYRCRASEARLTKDERPKTMDEGLNAEVRFQRDGWLCEVAGGELRLWRHGCRQASFPLAPLIEGVPALLGGWQKITPEHFQARLDRGGSVHLAIREGHVAYWMETDIVQFQRLTYFPGTTFAGRQWHTYSCDDTDRAWDVNRQTEVPISSAYADIQSVDGRDGQGMTDPGDNPQSWIWNVPVRAAALQTEAGLPDGRQAAWLGLSIPGPIPVGVTRFTMDRRALSVTFEVLRSTCPDWGMPVVYFVPGLNDPYDLLDEHRAISDRLGLTVRKPADHPAWWANVSYVYWDEYLCMLKDPDLPEPEKKLTAARYLSWLAAVKESVRVRDINVTFEQGCYNLYGDYTPVPELGGVEGVRKMIDALREEGTHSGYYIHPFLVNTKLPVFREHPEFFCRPRQRGYHMTYGLEMRDKEAPEFAPLDWTHPGARDYMMKQVEFLLSDRPGCLNADVLRSNHWRGPDPRVYEFHGPDWGIGDLMTVKVQKMLYEKAKDIKPHCAVSKVAVADCYMQPYADIDLLCEEWSGETRNWYRRGRIATRLLRDMIFITDAYFVTMTKSYEYHMGMASWNVPETSTVRHAVHPYTHYREFQEKAYRRRRAGFQVYLNAPFNSTDRCRVDWDGSRARMWRRRTRGALTGWYAALALSHRCFVTYSDREARVAASESRTDLIPLPPGAQVRTVRMIPHEGEAQPWEFRLVGSAEAPAVEMFIEDCGKDALYYRIVYEIESSPK